MENVLREILKNNKYFEEINPDRYVPEFLGLIVNGVVVYHVNWIDIVENEIVFMHKDIQTHPIVSLVLDNLNSLMIITNEGILIRIMVEDISIQGRVTSGVKLINIESDSDIMVASLAKVKDDKTKESEDDIIKNLEKELEEE